MQDDFIVLWDGQYAHPFVFIGWMMPTLQKSSLDSAMPKID
ncbi:MAG TPA: hypothetical protein V6D25_12300 [Leptolyngbyaceae cyanobacterium]